MRYAELEEEFKKDIEEHVKNAIAIVNQKWVEKLINGKIEDLEALSQFDLDPEKKLLLDRYKMLISDVLRKIAQDFYHRERPKNRA